MPEFMESLESRTLLTAAQDAFLLDLGNAFQLNVNAATKLKGIKSVYANDTSGIGAGLKGTGAANASLVAALGKAIKNFENSLASAFKAFYPPGLSLAKNCLKTESALVKQPTLKLIATTTSEQNLLLTVVDAPLTNLTNVLDNDPVQGALKALGDANPGNAGLASVIATVTTFDKFVQTSVKANAVQFQDVLKKASTDFGTVEADATAFPNIQDSYTGSVTLVTGKNAGVKEPLALSITAEDAVGGFSGSFPGTGVAVSGSINLAGAFKFKANSATFVGTTDGNGTLTGTLKEPGQTGTFTFSNKKTIAG